MPALERIRDQVLAPKSTRKVHVECPRCKHMAGGKNMKTLTVELDDVEVYDLREVNQFLKLLLDFGVGKPAEEKNVNHQVNVDLTAMTLGDKVKYLAELRAQRAELTAGDDAA